MAFLKDDPGGKLLHLAYRPATGPSRKLRIKLEVDANPPAGGSFDTKYLDFPFPSAICVFDLPSLFAGKVHALLCREYVKRRDWYDFIWHTVREDVRRFVKPGELPFLDVWSRDFFLAQCEKLG